MKLNHINLVVTNVAEAIHFFETYFNFNCIDVKGDDAIAILQGTDGFELVLMSATMIKNEEFNYPANFHVGFKQNKQDDVDSIYRQLKVNGLEPGREPGKIRDSYGFYFYFDKIMIEVGTS
jgi:catechol 2,3-dioxygenase-like lactoylglutathione lyase family enzyme